MSGTRRDVPVWIDGARAALGLGVALLLAAPVRAEGVTTRVSVTSDHGQANGNCSETAISADGRYVAFRSAASNLVLGDTNGVTDVFVHDRLTGATRRVSVDSSGTQANGESSDPVLSADGLWVAFRSTATNLVPGDTNGWEDVFVHELATGETTRASVATGGMQANGRSMMPSLSGDGRFVAFMSGAQNLGSGGHGQIYVRDRLTGETRRISTTPTGGLPGNQPSLFPSISANGRFVAFSSSASNLVPGDTNTKADIFSYDRELGVLERIDLGPSGEQANFDSARPSVSGDGRYVAYTTWATNLFPGDVNGESDVVLYDRSTGGTELVSVGPGGVHGDRESDYAAISIDGRSVAFSSTARNLVPGDTNNRRDVFVRDLDPGTTRRASLSSAGAQTDQLSEYPSIDADGRTVAFQSWAESLVDDDTNGFHDIFVRDESCDGNVIVYCGAQTNSAGCVPAISAAGTPSASAGSGFTISVGNTLAGQSGMFFYGLTGPASLPFHGGTLCAAAPLFRTPVQNSGGLPPCGGSFSIDFDALIASGVNPALVAGRTLWGQWWSRDPGFPPPNNTNLSDAVRATICH